ncbi:hypothetical protein NDU88_000814 [Pleurodeles waltl]|uniref:Uncharacterized protein n=1 Tax=Pleurodeles waltl TaxID=8319 RepID=A0AAV7LB76_PLEWA|nr:hypothetical protein NDU88_000814 [Pleurodeles waltl]
MFRAGVNEFDSLLPSCSVVRNKEQPPLQANKIDEYAVLRPAEGIVVGEDTKRGLGEEQIPQVEPSLRVIMVAFRDPNDSVNPKLDAATVDVTLLRVDLMKVLEKVTTAKSDIGNLQSISKRLVQFLTKENERIMARLEDYEGEQGGTILE